MSSLVASLLLFRRRSLELIFALTFALVVTGCEPVLSEMPSNGSAQDGDAHPFLRLYDFQCKRAGGERLSDAELRSRVLSRAAFRDPRLPKGLQYTPQLLAQPEGSSSTEEIRSAKVKADYKVALNKPDYSSAALYLNGFSPYDLAVEVKKNLTDQVLVDLRKAAAQHPDLGGGQRIVHHTFLKNSIHVLARHENPKVTDKSTMDPYVDDFSEILYGIDYQHAGGDPSKWLRVTYADGAKVDIHFYDFDLEGTAVDNCDNITKAYKGAAGRIFPYELNKALTPRLWAARKWVEDNPIGTYNLNMTRLGATAALYVLTVPSTAMGMAKSLTEQGARLRPTVLTITPSSLAKILGDTEYAALKAAAEAAKNANPKLAALTIDEIIALRAYSGEAWSYINAALRLKDAKELTRLGKLIELMKSGLSKLSIYKGTVTRRIAMPITEAVQKYRAGATVIEDAFTSTTFGKAVAQREGNVLLTIESSTGRDITAISVHNESEILFPPGTKFLIEKVQTIGDAVLVTLKEAL